MTASRYFNLNVTNDRLGSPIARSNPSLTALQLQNFFAAAAGGVRAPSVHAEWDALIAQGNVAVAVTGSGDQTITVNGVANTAAWDTDANETADDLVTAILEQSSVLVSKAVVAARVQRPASAYFTISSATGALSPQVGGTACPFTATGDNTADAILLAAAIASNGTAGKKVVAIANYGGTAGKVQLFARDGATATFTLTGSAGTYYATIAGVTASAAYDTSTTVTAAALAADINAKVGSLVHATSSAGVVTVVSKGNSALIRVTGTGITALGGAITISSGAGDLTVFIKGIATTVTWATSDTATAAALVTALNAKAAQLDITQATSSAGVISVWRSSIADNDIVISGSGGGGATCTASGTTLAGAGAAYGGILGNAIALASASGVTRSAATLSAGLTSVALTAKLAGFAGNWVTSAATGDALTANGAQLIGGTATQETFPY